MIHFTHRPLSCHCHCHSRRTSAGGWANIIDIYLLNFNSENFSLVKYIRKAKNSDDATHMDPNGFLSAKGQ
jgi:hypothetical protein